MWVEFNINMFTCTISLPNYIVDYKDLFILHTYSLAVMTITRSLPIMQYLFRGVKLRKREISEMIQFTIHKMKC